MHCSRGKAAGASFPGVGRDFAGTWHGHYGPRLPASHSSGSAGVTDEYGWWQREWRVRGCEPGVDRDGDELEVGGAPFNPRFCIMELMIGKRYQGINITDRTKRSPWSEIKRLNRFTSLTFQKALDPVTCGNYASHTVDDVDRLVGNLCTLWVGRFHLHANVVRFERPTLNPKPPVFPKSLAGSQTKFSSIPGSFINAVKGLQLDVQVDGTDIQALMLDDSCVFVQDLSRHVMGKVKDVSSISNMHIILLKEGFPGVKLSYLGGLWLLIELDNGFVRDKFLSHTGVKLPFEDGGQAILLLGLVRNGGILLTLRKIWLTPLLVNVYAFRLVYMVRAKELFAWSPSFLSPKDTKYTSDDESIHNNGNTSEGQHNIGDDFNLDSEVEEVADTIFEDKPESLVNNECHSRDKEGDILSPDPFELYDLLNKHPNKSEKELDPSLSHPPGFTLEASRKEDINIEDAPIVENDKEGSSTAQSKPEDCYVNEVINDNSTSSRPEAHKGGSILGLLDDLIQIGQSMGYEMEGCIKDIGNIIEAQGDVLIVVIYTPQSIVRKRVLWEYITLLISRWDGETIVIGDFNEVRSIDERFGSVFNGSSARHFNRFIETSGLTDVNLEGYAFTWSHPSRSKMSKLDRFLISDGNLSSFPSMSALCLDRHLSDHRPILLREVFSDFGPIPFRVFHSWLKVKVKEWSISRILMTLNTLKLTDLDSEERNLRGLRGSFPIGSNASFIALIPKVADANFVADFRPISLIGSVYKVVTKILANRLATVISDLVSDTQTAFVAYRQILDGPFILNELFSWCKRKKKQAMIFKVDFEKAYDYVRWAYLMDVLHAFGFGPNWCKWISGDPLAPFLFILIMESLHISFSGAINNGIFKGIQISESTVLSHLFYADDAIFMGEWSEPNMGNIIKILRCFFLASGLKINIHKSQIMGVGVHRNLVSQAATIIGCSVMHAPFRYLGVMVGDCMTRLSAWSDSLQKLHQRLSKWKAKTLSIGGRLTLLKSVLGASPIYNLSIFKAPVGILKDMERIRSNFFKGADLSDRKISWVAWDKALASKKSGGLGISSYFALNRALLLKWVWRFISQDGSLWFRVIQSLYGFNFVSHCKIRIGDGCCTRFWYDSWTSEQPLCIMFPRIFALESTKDSTVECKFGLPSVDVSFRRPVRDGVERKQWNDLCEILDHVILSSSKDRWYCDLSGDGEFRVKEVRSCLDNILLPSSDVPTRWVSLIPIKINIFAWRARLDRLPTRSNLACRGIVMDSVLCPICGSDTETISHILFRLEEHLVVPCSNEEIVKYLTQPATTEISGEDGSNLEEFLDVLTVEEAGIPGPIMVIEDEPLMVLGSDNIINEDFLNDFDGQHSADENLTNVWLKQERVCPQRRTWDLGWISAGMSKEYVEVLRRVKGGNNLTILLPFEEEQAELKLVSEV
ncbi:RNA-directed DNA polymerase, eukaryota [Tanacetum coccineum]